MENFLATVVFLLPGFLMYFWIQSFGVNPVVKHSSIELTAISALLWLPVTVATLTLLNLSILVINNIPVLELIWTLEDLQRLSGNLIFLLIFLSLSVLVSFVVSVFYTKYIFKFQLKVINKVRNWRGVADLSNTSSVWEEIFLKNDTMVVEIGKIDSEDKSQIGCIMKASRPFEPERHLVLEDVDFLLI
ncbi:hypothetical protein H1D32_13410 [Anaerobacillus sp. CMMVII]|uniref:hypothetical protein n=1 Tax=Anaerobacillus sp. CMMVII TaxID=2755588 RepID=UPI0021B8091F|nr:hypothetical protein [Anaerobacillus sp. CMMVII]MCT8138652.1 hypothetical protein [Anaerobacillus sp. CMMVII]